MGSFLRNLALLALFVASLWLAWRPQGSVVTGPAHVVDGDTIKVAGEDIRLEGLDAPEMRQLCARSGRPYACGEEAHAALIAHIAARPVTCRISGRDRYRRALAACSVDGEDLGAWLVREGYAVSYGGYQREEALARAAGRGIWAAEFMQPEEWRRENLAR